MRGTNSGGKTKRGTRSVSSKRVGNSEPPAPLAKIVTEVDPGRQSTRQKMFTFSTVPGKQFNKLAKKIINRDYVQIIATKDIALSFATKWGQKRRLDSLYLVGIDSIPREE
jgi:hypothetical protein